MNVLGRLGVRILLDEHVLEVRGERVPIEIMRGGDQYLVQATAALVLPPGTAP